MIVEGSNDVNVHDYYLNGVNKWVTIHSVVRGQKSLTRGLSTHNLKKKYYIKL